MQRENLFAHWLENIARPGDGFRYHSGHLACDRKDDPALDRLADEVYRRSDLEIPVVPPGADYHIRQYLQGTGECRLMTERAPDGSFVYIAVKR